MPRTKGTPTQSLEDVAAAAALEVTFETPTFVPALPPPSHGPTHAGGGGGGKSGKSGKSGKGKKSKSK